jgi:hypothetical protein
MCDVSVAGGTVQGILSALTGGQAPPVTTPAVPATTVTAANSNAFPVAVAIALNGATISAVNVNGVATGFAGACTVVVPPGGTVAIAYTVATPTWVWSPLLAGAAASPLPNPTVVPVAPGASVTLIYTVAPTWTWANPNNIPGSVSAGGEALFPMNTQTVAGSGEIPGLPSSLPVTSRSMGGQVGLGVAESN